MPNQSQIENVFSFSELVKDNFSGIVNARCWKRNLEGDFKEIVSKLQLKENITEVTPEDLLILNLSENGNKAREVIISDYNLLKQIGAQPSINLLKCYEKDDEFDFISTDVYSYHVDRSPILMDTFLCTYHGESSDIITNDNSILQISIPEIREKLKTLFDGPEEEFEIFIKDNYFDLHYQAKENAKPINLGLGNLWRLAVDHPEQKVLPCVHRAPIESDGELRLMIIC